MLRATTRNLSTSARVSKALPSSLVLARESGAPIDVHPEVEQALAENRPLVALETTIVTHGMPYPVNLETARSVERNVRSVGAIPATIGVIGGRVKIGLEPAQLEYLADVHTNPGSVKLSRRDIAAAISLKKDGGTTCSATLIFAALAGIKVFATGGLGGVHRGGQDSMDISADLQELTRCSVGLVSAGVKSILDIGRTLEYLETLGVPVLTYGETQDFPAFYTPRSGFKSPWRVNDPATAANVLLTQERLGMANGALFGVPIPESYAVVGEELQKAVEQAIRESHENGMNKRGKEVTPWLLDRVRELTEGKSLASNVALIENTALKGAQIAVAYADLVKQESGHVTIANVPVNIHREETPVPAKLVVVGSAAVDVISQANATFNGDTSRGVHSTSPGSVTVHLGGVGRNVAEAAHRTLGTSMSTTLLVSSIGDDSFGRLLHEEMGRIGMRTDGLVTSPTARSAVCNMVLDSTGNLIGGVADMDIIRSLEPENVTSQIAQNNPTLVSMDANLSPEVLKALVQHCSVANIRTFFEPTSVIKSISILPAIAAALQSTPGRTPITFASPNLLELAELYRSSRMDPWELTGYDHWWKTVDDFSIGTDFRLSLEQLARRSASDDESDKRKLSFLVEQGTAQMAINLLPFFEHLVVKCGDLGVLIAMRIPRDRPTAWIGERKDVGRRQLVVHGKTGTLVLKHYPAHVVHPESIVSVTGAGDTLVGSVLATLVEKPLAFDDPVLLDKAVYLAQTAATQTLRCSFAVSPSLST
ncbi:indigoidine synthase A-like protein [Gloeopeniophorella convolvens]|nr:indigoidine synthase A-like protein [Gloeopeniophorella convolvens]